MSPHSLNIRFMKFMKKSIIVQARTGSTRLPGKVMKKIVGKSVLEHIIERLKKCAMSDQIIIATTVKSRDDVIVEIAKKCQVDYFRGSEENVLERYYQAAAAFGVSHIIRITSDCPLVDPEIVDRMIGFYMEHCNNYDYVSNNLERTYPLGLECEVMSFWTFKTAYLQAKASEELEHVHPYIHRNPEIFRICQIKNRIDFSNEYYWALDTEEDLKLIRIIYEKLYSKNRLFLFKDILDLFKKFPSLNGINKNVHSERYKQWYCRKKKYYDGVFL